MKKIAGFLPLAILIFGIDWLCFPILKYWISDISTLGQRIISIVFFSIPIQLIILLLGEKLYRWRKKNRRIYTGALSFYQLLYICKVFALIALVLVSLVASIFWLINLTGMGIPDIQWIGYPLATLVAAIPFFLLPYGILVNRHRYQIRRKKVRIKGLHKSLKGLRIVQISDIHSGSFYDKSGFEKGVRLINSLKPDLIFITGDLVNNRAVEFEPFKETFAKLKAKHGVFSVLGNHDYGDYVVWRSREAKLQNIQTIVELQKSIGWDVLLNEHRMLSIGNADIAVIGVENYSAKLSFPKYGDLSKAYEGTDGANLKLLLSHDPSHWRYEVLPAFPEIDITFSGHTHGMQFGFEYGSYKWSPISYIYKEWAGLYAEGAQHLYVNRGFGVLGYPGRVGILPEITLITLV